MRLLDWLMRRGVKSDPVVGVELDREISRRRRAALATGIPQGILNLYTHRLVHYPSWFRSNLRIPEVTAADADPSGDILIDYRAFGFGLLATMKSLGTENVPYWRSLLGSK